MRTDAVVEVGWGGTVADPDTIVWDDISTRVDLTTGISITRGAQDEFAETQTGTMTVRLDNSDGALTPGRAGSPYDPYVKMNVPIRAAVVHYPDRAGAAPWPLETLADGFDNGQLDPVFWPASYGGVTEAGGRARIPCTPGVPAGLKSGRQWTLTGSQFVVRLTSLPAAGGSSSASLTVVANSTTAGTRAGFYYSPLDGYLRCMSDVGGFDGAAAIIPYNSTYHLWLRLREAGGTLYWETSPDGYSWAVQRTLTTPAWVGAGPVTMELIGARTGGAGDTIEVSYAGGVTYPRFYGVVNQWPVRWDGLESTVTITCSDLLKRLGRDRQLRSCLSEEIMRTPELAAYYPLVEASDAATSGDLSGQGAGPLGIVQVGAGGTLAFGSAAGPAAAPESLPVLTPASATAGKVLSADLGPGYETASMDPIAMEVWFQTTVAGRVIVALTSASGAGRGIWSLNGSGALQLETMGDGVTTVTATFATGNLADGQWHHIAYDEVGPGEMEVTVLVDGIDTPPSLMPLALGGMRTLTVGGFAGARLWSGAIGHLALYAMPLDTPMGTVLGQHYTAGDNAFAGETADLRIQRLVSYTGLDGAIIYGTQHDPVAGQGPSGSSALARMREVETTESGKLFPARDWLAMDYASRDMRYNPSPDTDVFTIEYADLETDDVELADDDQKLINTVIGSRPGGATQRVVDAASVAAVGTYAPPGGDLSILKTSDNAVLSAAQWLVSRYADPSPELREVPVEAYSHPDYLGILGADIGSRFNVTSLPAQAPAPEARITVEGYTETIGLARHRIQFHTSRAETDTVWVLDDALYSQLGSTTRLAY
ncbi:MULTISPECIES: hypothetical protein [Actinomycetes]|uniref:hypothetical protein n=1 Tax=Actinomycetes TaxID=1760 RepID=UPI0033F6B179